MEKHYLRDLLFLVLLSAIVIFWGFFMNTVTGLLIKMSNAGFSPLGLASTYLNTGWLLLSGIAVVFSIFLYFVKRKVKTSFLIAFLIIVSFFIAKIIERAFFNTRFG